jgi:acyl carrier protein
VHPVDEHGLVFTGRGDRQVKRLGHRIELGEVEAALCRVATIEQAVAVQLATGGALNALVTPADGLSETEVRDAVSKLLPSQAVPMRIVRADALPSNAHGKLDTRAVLDCLADMSDGGSAYRPDQLAALWRDVLGVDKVAPDDDFFALGGDSLAVVELVEGISAALGLDLELGTLFTHATFGAFAEVVSQLAEEAA